MYHSSLFDPNANAVDIQTVINQETQQHFLNENNDLNLVPMNISSNSEEKSGDIINEMFRGSTKRHDVCIKSILRAMRRFYCFKMETSTQYKRKEKKIKLKHETLVKCCIRITEEMGLNNFSPNMSFYFSLFSYPCDMKKIFDKLKAADPTIDISLISKAVSVINLIDNALNRFSKKILDRLLSIPEISHLIQYFLNEGKSYLENTNEYKECILILDHKSKV